MPSPVGHALGGIAAGWHAAPRRGGRAALVLALVAIAPDLDLLIGDHRGLFHSIGLAVIAGAAAWIVTRGEPRAAPRWALATTLAWTSHVALDWLSNDTRPPIGVMALWPLTHAYYKAGLELFPAVSRRYWALPEFLVYNAKALAVELLILAPLTILIVRTRRSR